MKQSKQIWVNHIQKGSSISPVNSYNPYIDTCAICRNKLSDLCSDCHVTVNENEYIEKIKNIWNFLLINHNRKDSLFNLVDLNIISLIYEFCVSGDYETKNCHIITLECNHTYHRHCFQKWINKRQVCPLDNSKLILPIEVVDPERCNIRTKLKTFKSEYTWEEICNRNQDKVNVQGVTCRLLKHNKPGYKYDKLYKLTCEKFIRKIDKDIFLDFCKKN